MIEMKVDTSGLEDLIKRLEGSNGDLAKVAEAMAEAIHEDADERVRTETQDHTAETTKAAGCESGGSVKLRPLTCERKRTMENGPEGPQPQAHKADPPAARGA